ncbi:hypothetical protein ACQJBY_059385 [Aegilops geniculata]
MDGVAVPHQETNPHAIPDPHVTSFLLIFLPWWWHMWLGDCVDLGDLVDSGNAVTEMSRENAGCTAQTCRSWGCGGIEGGGGGRVSPRQLPRQAKLSVCTTVERSVICLHPRLLLIKLQKQVGRGFVVRSACFGVTSSDVE